MMHSTMVILVIGVAVRKHLKLLHSMCGGATSLEQQYYCCAVILTACIAIGCSLKNVYHTFFCLVKQNVQHK